MKKIIIILLALSLLFFTSCDEADVSADPSENGDKMSIFEFFTEKYNKYSLFADPTPIMIEAMENIVNAIEEDDATILVDMFSTSIQNDDDSLQENAEAFIEFVKGDFVSHTSEKRLTPNTSNSKNEGKRTSRIRWSFKLKTTEDTYHIFVSKCTIDEIDENNVGVTSIHIVSQSEWSKVYTYWGDGYDTPGIVIQAVSEFSLYDVYRKDGMYCYTIYDESGNVIDEGSRDQKVEVTGYTDHAVSVRWMVDEYSWEGYIVNAKTSAKTEIIPNLYVYDEGNIAYIDEKGVVVVESVWNADYHKEAINIADLEGVDPENPVIDSMFLTRNEKYFFLHIDYTDTTKTYQSETIMLEYYGEK